MNNQELFNENVDRVNKGKKRSIGGALSLNDAILGRIFYLKQLALTRFCLNAQYEGGEVIHYEMTYSNKDTPCKSPEEIQGDTIFFALTYGDDEKAGVSIHFKEKYYHLTPKTSGYFSLYFDALMQKSPLENSSIVSFVVLVDTKVSDTEVFFGSTDNKAVSEILYALASHYRR